MTRNDWKCAQHLKKLVNQNAKIIERIAKKAQRGNYEEMAEYFNDVCDVKITIDGNFRYCNVVIQLAFGNPNIYFDSAVSKVYGVWGGLEFEKVVDFAACDTVDDYYEDYYESCR